MHAQADSEYLRSGEAANSEGMQRQGAESLVSGMSSNRPEAIAQRKLQALADASSRSNQQRVMQQKVLGTEAPPSAAQTVQRQAYRNAPWTNAGQYTNTGPFLEQIEGRDWMKIAALQAYPHIQEQEIAAARGGAAPGVAMTASNAGAWRVYSPGGASWTASVDPTRTVFALDVAGPYLSPVMNKIDGAWGSINVQETDIRHLSTHNRAYTMVHRHSVMPPGVTINAANMDVVATALGERRQFDGGGFTWAGNAGQRAGVVATWSGNLAANLL